MIATFGVVTTIFVTAGMAGHITNRFAIRILNIKLNYYGYNSRAYSNEGTCFLRHEQRYIDFNTTCIPQANSNATIIWGDSHAAMLSYGLRNTTPNVFQLTAMGCQPVKAEVSDSRPHCHDVNEFIIKTIAATKPSRLIIHANWKLYPNFATGLERAINLIKMVSPNTEIILVGGVPQWKPDLPTFAWLNGIMPDRSLKVDNPTIGDIRGIDRS